MKHANDILGHIHIDIEEPRHIDTQIQHLETTPIKISEVKINEEYQSILDPYSPADYESFKDSISKQGVLKPIDLNEKYEILDGYHRFHASSELGYHEILARIHHDFNDDPFAEKSFVITCNLDRRHLTPFQRIRLVMKLEGIETELARARQLAGTSVPIGTKVKGRVIDILAKKARVSPMTFVRGKEVLFGASTEDTERVLGGKARIDKIYKDIQKQKKRQQLILEAKKIPMFPEGFKLVHGDCVEECKNIPDNSIDCIFTDPPYSKEFLPLWEELGTIANRVLKPGGSLSALIGGYCIPQVLNLLLESRLKYNWLCYMKHTGPSQALHGNHVIVLGKPILWFYKGDKLAEMEHVTDFVESRPPDKSSHDWAQSPVEAEHFICRLTGEHEIVFDPFMGSEAFGIAALKLKRQFIGIEIDKDRFDIARANIAREAAGA